MKTIVNPPRSSWSKLTKRPVSSLDAIEDQLKTVFEDVQSRGDSAVLDYTNQFDGVHLKSIQVSKHEIEVAKTRISDSLKSAINHARINIERFHKTQQRESEVIETTPGVFCWQESRPIDRVGLYIPGGTAPLFSTVLMLAIPAKIAGCSEIIICTPPKKDGSVAEEILYTADLCGVTKIFKVGGMQAVAAMTFGTPTIPKVYKIFGPGNQYVTAAKQYALKYGVAIDMPAGPSELLVVADAVSNAQYIASDLLSQAEHGSDSQVVLVSLSLDKLVEVEAEVYRQLKELPRKHLASMAISNSKLICFDNKQNALDFINAYAPEHFIICNSDEEFFVNGILNAGSVFVGPYTPESAGDYASGTNHTLPTNGYAKNYSGVSLDSFTRLVSFQKLSADGLRNLGETIEVMAEAEGLFAHKNAVSLRLKDLEK
ncbi:MAG: histidinol dehydrogenase [Bacteroidia bacterium]|nr:histidinol dehydrogenase [Bacteroidia bacterium]